MRSSKADVRPLVWLLLNNDALNDGRVLKTAQALNDNGYEVVILGRLLPEAADVVDLGFARVERFPCFEQRSEYSPLVEREAAEMFGPLGAWIGETVEAYRTSTANYAALREEYDELRTVLPTLRDRAEVAAAKTKIANVRSDLNLAKERLRDIKIRRSFELHYYYYTVNLLSRPCDRQPAIIHCNDLHPLPAAVALARRFKVPLILDAHEIEVARPTLTDPERIRFIDTLERHLLQSVDRMIVAGESSADVYAERFGRGRPTVVLNTPVEHEDQDGGGPDIRELCGVPPDVPLLVYTGNIGFEGRGVDKLVQALHHLDGVHFATLGSRNVRSDEWLAEIVAAEGLGARVHMVGPVPHRDVVRTIRSGTIGVCAIQDTCLNHRYCMPNKLFEACFAGLPLCVSDFPDMGEVVKSLEIGVTFDEKDPIAIANAIRQVLNNRDLYRPTPEKMQKMRDRYGWRVQADALIQLYREVLPRPVPRRWPRLSAGLGKLMGR